MSHCALVVLALFLLTSQSQADSGWKLNPDNFFEYKGLPGTYTIHEAKQACARYNAVVAAPRSSYEQRFIRLIDQSNLVWIGVTDVQQEGVWRYFDGGRVEWSAWDYMGRNDVGDYAAISMPSRYFQYKWKIVPGDSKYIAVCKRKKKQEWKADSRNRYEYTLFDGEWRIDEAKQRCNEHNAVIATPRNMQEQNFLRAMCPDCWIWLGISDERHETSWRYFESGGLTWSNWRSGQPDNAGGNQDIAALPKNAGVWAGEKWVAVHWLSELRVICRRSIPAKRSQGWKRYYANNYEYKLLIGTSLIDDAKKRCSNRNAVIATPRSRAEQSFIRGMCLNCWIWLGINDSAFENTWKYYEGGTITWSNWYHGQPDNHRGNEDIAALPNGYYGRWIDVGWTRRLHTICKRKIL